MAKVKSKSTVRDNKQLKIWLSTCIVLFSLVYTIILRWIGDDIFIGLRYVQNFIAGHGLVYNVGERVEGYTDFLWLMLISFFTWLKFDPATVAQALGILFSIGTLIIFLRISFKITPSTAGFIFPFIPLALALNYDYNVWATGGLEVAFFTFLLSMAFYVYFFSGYKANKRNIVTGMFLMLSVLTRPDALLIYFVSNVLLIVNYINTKIKLSTIVKNLFYFNLAFIIIYIPYFFWRFNYYGFLFPNTYYVKLADESNFSQGFYYIWLYFGIHFTSLFALILPLFLLFRPGKNKSNLHNATLLYPPFITSIIILVIYLIGFVAKVGGDFMFARFIIPLTPFIYFIIWYVLLKIVSPVKLNKLALLLIFLSMAETFVRFNVFRKNDESGNPVLTLKNGIADERNVHVNYASIELEKQLGKAVHRAFDGTNSRLLIAAGQACFGYYANFYYCQELHGLTDTVIAHSDISLRGRIGHEKSGTMEYFQKKGIHFIFNRELPVNDNFRRARFILPPFDVDMIIVTYNTEIMNELQNRFGNNLMFTNFPVYLDEYVRLRLPVISKEELKKEYENFRLYYFLHNNDNLRESHFINLIN